MYKHQNFVSSYGKMQLVHPHFPWFIPFHVHFYNFIINSAPHHLNGLRFAHAEKSSFNIINQRRIFKKIHKTNQITQ